MFVLELSSFQLETTSSLAPVAATVLNVTGNHLDRYAGIDDYAAAKARIFAHGGVQVLNRDDPDRAPMRDAGRTVQTFGAGVPLSRGGVGPGRAAQAHVARARRRAARAETSRLSLVGRHNALNALAALALACCGRASRAARCSRRCAQFDGLPHRMAARSPKRAACSTSTTPRARRSRRRRSALDGIGRPVVLIAGGDGKGQNFAPLKASGRRALPRRAADRPRRAAGRARLAGTRRLVETVGHARSRR